VEGGSGWGQSRVVQGRDRETGGRDKAQKAERRLGETGGGSVATAGKMDEDMKLVVAARAAVEFSRVLDGLKIVGHRDHGEQDHDEHRQRGYLRPSVCAFARSIAKPQHTMTAARKIQARLRIISILSHNSTLPVLPPIWRKLQP